MFKQRLKTLRLRYKLTQNEIAKKIGVAQQTYGHWESGNNEPDHKTLIMLAKFFNVSTDHLLGIELKETLSEEPSQNTEEEAHLLDLLRNTTPERRRIYEMMLENEQSIPNTTNNHFRKTI